MIQGRILDVAALVELLGHFAVSSRMCLGESSAITGKSHEAIR